MSEDESTTRDSPTKIHQEGYSSDGFTTFVPSSPIRGTTKEKVAARRAKGQKKRQVTIALSNAARKDRLEWRENQLRQNGPESPDWDPNASQSYSTQTEDISTEVYQCVLNQLDVAGLTWGSFIEWISDPTSSCEARLRYEGFFHNRDQVKRVLNHWTSWRNCTTGRMTVDQWATDRVKQRIEQEGNSATKSCILQSHTMAMDKSFILDFDLTALYEQLLALCPSTESILRVFCTTSRQSCLLNDKTALRKKLVSRRVDI